MPKNNKSEKEHGKATIVMVIGTSSAGKSTIIREVMKQDQEKKEEERLGWVENGVDMEYEKINNLKQQIIGQTFEEAKNNPLTSKACTDLIALGFPPIVISQFVINGKLNFKGKDVDLLGEVNQKFYDQLAEPKPPFADLQNLKIIIENYRTPLNEKLANISNQVANICDDAIKNSKEGRPTIFDVVPVNGIDMVAKFYQYLESKNFSCPVIIVLAYCNMGKITEHNEKRNQSGNPKEKRETFPISHYTALYYATDDVTKKVDQLTIQDLLDASNKFGKGGNSTSLEENEEAKKSAEQLGILKLYEGQVIAPDKPIFMATNVNYDKLYYTDPGNVSHDVTAAIVKDLNRLVTRESFVPKDVHPLARIVKNHEADKAEELAHKKVMAELDAELKVEYEGWKSKNPSPSASRASTANQNNPQTPRSL